MSTNEPNTTATQPTQAPKRKKQDLFDMPIIGYFMLTLFGYMVVNVSAIGDTIMAFFIPGYGTNMSFAGRQIPIASGVCVGVVALAACAVFWFFFKPEFKGMLRGKFLLKGILLLLPVLLIHWAGSVVSWFEWGHAGAYGIFIALLRAVAPGFGEEVTFRGLGISNYMRTIKDESGIVKIWLLSSAVFGAIHFSNVMAGAPVLVTLIQSVYAMGIGMALGAAFLRTGNLWACILVHMSLDFMEFIRTDLNGSGGIMSNMGVGDWITIGAGAVAAIWGFYLIRKSVRPDIMALWKAKWEI